MANLLNVSNIRLVNWQATVEGQQGFKTYEFLTWEDILVEEAETYYDLFRLFIYDDGTKEISSANDVDYDVHEDVSDLFDVDAIHAYCESIQVDDMTDEYIAYYEDEIDTKSSFTPSDLSDDDDFIIIEDEE